MLEIIISFKRNWCSFERKNVGQKRKSLRLAKGCFYWRGKLLLPLAKNSWRQPEMKHYITQERCSLLKKLLTEELHRRILPIYILQRLLSRWGNCTAGCSSTPSSLLSKVQCTVYTVCSTLDSNRFFVHNLKSLSILAKIKIICFFK